MLGSGPSMENSRKLILVLAFLVPGLPVAAQQTDPDVIWKGDFEAGPTSLTGHCSAGDDQWCSIETTRPQQIQVVADPVAQGKYAARFEVKYGDLFSYYSDSRSLMSGPSALWENEGNERWYRWQALWPQDWVGSYPKWDQLSDPSARSWAGSLVEWHHDANGGVEHGSAPLYIRSGGERWLTQQDWRRKSNSSIVGQRRTQSISSRLMERCSIDIAGPAASIRRSIASASWRSRGQEDPGRWLWRGRGRDDSREARSKSDRARRVARRGGAGPTTRCDQRRVRPRGIRLRAAERGQSAGEIVRRDLDRQRASSRARRPRRNHAAPARGGQARGARPLHRAGEPEQDVAE